MAPGELAELERKYRSMGELRAELPPTGELFSMDQRARLKRLAAEFPGALRELDTLTTGEIEQRRAALERARAGGPVEEWMGWMHAYHALMRAALAIKRRLAGREPISDPERLRIGEATGVQVDEALLGAVADPPHGRLNVVVFARLGARFKVAPKLIWDTLFPPRPGRRPYRSG